jgi:two-component system response regulator GlrR
MERYDKSEGMTKNMFSGEKPRILVVDDNSQTLQLIELTLSRQGFDITTTTNGLEALEFVKDPDQVFHCVITDRMMPHIDGMELLRKINEINPEIPIIILTAYGSIENAVEALKHGAYDYIIKPFQKEDLIQKTFKAVEKHQLTRKIKELRAQVSQQESTDMIIGQSPATEEVLNQISLVAGSDVSVIIYGESGTGKELAARAIHLASHRSTGPFIVANCGAIPKDLMENELFGHVRGAYTDAHADKSGLFEEAHGGSIFLDEIGEIASSVQVKLLRVLQDHQIKRVGSSRSVEVDVRVIAATNRDLAKAIQLGEFREDLYYRLNVIPITMPPLRKRKEDIPLIANHFIKKYREEMNPHVTGITPDTLHKLMMYDWPGNVRELENKIIQAMVLAKTSLISTGDLFLKDDQKMEEFHSFKQAKKEFERDYITRVLRYTDGNVSKAAKIAQKDRKDFYEVMKKHDIKAENFRK